MKILTCCTVRTSREEHRLEEFQNKILRHIFESREGNGESFTKRNYIVSTVQLILVRAIKSGGLRWVGHIDRMVKDRSALNILK